jgi:hypothetical protein
VYITTIQPLFDYCISVWGNASLQNNHEIQRLQNRCARAVKGDFDYNSSVSAMINTLNWMKFDERFVYFTCILVFKCLNELAPQRLCEKFHFAIDLQPYVTRYASDGKLNVPKCNTELCKKSLSVVRGPSIWNSLPSNIRNNHTLPQFKSNLKNYINEKH